MYVKYYKGDIGWHIYCDSFPYWGFTPLSGSECEWIIPGTVDPRED